MIQSLTAQPARNPPDETLPHVPGEAGIWVFVFGEMLAFAVLFVAFVYYRSQQPTLFAVSQRRLDVGFGVLDTVLLLTSSLLVATGVRSIRATERALAARFFAGAGALALLFVISKGLEYVHDSSTGIDPQSNRFFTLYYILTGVHLLHVLLGLIGLTVSQRIASRATSKGSDQLIVEVAASYWHLVDLLWIVIFPLLYLIR